LPISWFATNLNRVQDSAFVVLVVHVLCSVRFVIQVVVEVFIVVRL